MTHNTLDIIEEELFQDNIDSEIKENAIYWKDNHGAENVIRKSQTAVAGERIAWWQQNEVGKELVRIRLKKDLIVNWRPPINTMGLGSMGCDFLEFYEDFLVLRYRDKHRERVFIIHLENLEIEEINLKGYKKKMKRVEEKLYVKTELKGECLMISLNPEGTITEGINQEFLDSQKIILE